MPIVAEAGVGDRLHAAALALDRYPAEDPVCAEQPKQGSRDVGFSGVSEPMDFQARSPHLLLLAGRPC